MRMNSSKTILILSICMALQMTSFVIIVPLFARRFSELGAGVAAMGISEMAFALATTLSAPFMGALADRLGRKPLVLLSLVAHLAAFCGYLLAQTTLSIIVIRGLSGAFTAGFVPAVIGLAADVAPKDHQARWLGFINGGAAFGWIAGPIAGGMLYDRWGFTAALIISISIVVLALLVAFLWVPKARLSERLLTGIRQARKSRTWLSDLRSTLPNSLSAFIVLLSITFAELFAWAFVEPRLMFYAYNDLNWSSSMLGIVMGTYGVAMMIGELSLGGLSDRLGRKPVILLGLALFSAQFIGMAFFRNYIPVAVTFVIGGFGNALFDPAINAAILDISPVEHNARNMGIKSMVGSAGTILGPALVALLSTSIGARSIFLAAVGISFLATLSALAYPTRKRQAREHPSLEAGTGMQAAGSLTIETNTRPFS